VNLFFLLLTLFALMLIIAVLAIYLSKRNQTYTNIAIAVLVALILFAAWVFVRLIPPGAHMDLP